MMMSHVYNDIENDNNASARIQFPADGKKKKYSEKKNEGTVGTFFTDSVPSEMALFDLVRTSPVY